MVAKNKSYEEFYEEDEEEDEFYEDEERGRGF